MDSKYLCSTRRNFSQILRSNSGGALARARGEAAFCAGKGSAGTGHCCSCSPEALRSRALYSQYSVAKKGAWGISGFAHFGWQNWVQSISHPGPSLVFWSVEGPSLAPELPLIPSTWEGQNQLWRWILGCLLLSFSCLRALFKDISGEVFCVCKGLLGVFWVSIVVSVRVSGFA